MDVEPQIEGSDCNMVRSVIWVCKQRDKWRNYYSVKGRADGSNGSQEGKKKVGLIYSEVGISESLKHLFEWYWIKEEQKVKGDLFPRIHF